MRTPTTTSYALLGLLAIRPWSSYELAKQMSRTFRQVLPRAESNVYAEVKRLVVDGFATAERSATGRRGRTTYAISDLGRAALEEWLSTPARPASLESEPLVKLLFATTLPPAKLLVHVEAIRSDAEQALAPWVAIAEEYLDDRGPFPERLHVNVLYWVFQARYAAMQIEWARWAAGFIGSWPGVGGPESEIVKAELRRALEGTTPRRSKRR